MDSITGGRHVSFEYTLTLEDGTIVESNKGKTPMIYEHGKSEIITGLERQLDGMKVGDTRKIKVTAEEGYGQFDPEAFVEVPRKDFPEEALAIGTPLRGEGQEGNVIFMRVHEVKESTVVLDLNHPLAGENLLFDVRIVDIK